MYHVKVTAHLPIVELTPSNTVTSSGQYYLVRNTILKLTGVVTTTATTGNIGSGGGREMAMFMRKERDSQARNHGNYCTVSKDSRTNV